MKNFANRLVKLRKEKGLTQHQLAEILNISRGSLSMYELGQRNPDYETLQRLADYFDVSTDYLLGRSDKETLKDEPTTQEIEEIFQNQVMYQGVPMTEEEKESVKDFIRLAIKTIRAKKRGENNNA